MIWILIIILNSGGTVSAPQQSHEACLRGMAQVSFYPSVKVAYCIWGKP